MGGVKIWFSGSYSSVMFISPIIANCYKLSNKKIINWGGCLDYAKHFISNTPILTYDFISAGKSGRDHECMIKAANQINAKTIIITGYNKTLYDKSKITIISGNSAQKNSMKYDDVYKLYTQSRFIVIPVRKKNGKACYSLSGLTTFVDAAVLNKPILISDNTNIGVDVEKLGIGLSYHAGDENDMKRKMETLLSLSNEQYYEMCSNMRTLSHKYTYDCFCKQILEIIN